MCAGAMLLAKGIKWLLFALYLPENFKALLTPILSGSMPDALAIMLMVGFGLSLGYAKGKTVLAKAAGKMAARIHSFAGPIPIHQIFPVRFYLLIAVMVGLGISIRFLPYVDMRGIIDVAIGSALIVGSAFYLRTALVTHKDKT